MGIGNHQSPKMKTDEWLTPPEIVNALGPFDLDPCSPIIRPWDTAKTHFSLPTELFQPDGLSRDWSPYGRIWLNPPYGQQTGKWMMKLSYHNKTASPLSLPEQKPKSFLTMFGIKQIRFFS